MTLYKTDIAHGVECKFYKIKNTPIKARNCKAMISHMIIREPAMADKAAFILAMQRSQALHSPWVVSPQTEEKFDEYIQRSQKANQKCFLACNVFGNITGVFNISEIVQGMFQSAYLGFYSVANYAGQGYMSHSLKLVLKNIFEEIKLHRIEANIQPENVRSINLVKANGFSKEGFSPRYLNINGVWCDHERWALTYEDWIKCRL
jgi:RimJ/RimL family protein N-acetyltransferase